MSDELPLRSFEVEGFRAIRHLRLPELGRVNLFVGKNNAGKTSLLEALRIFLSRSPRTSLFDLIQQHAGPQPGPGRVGRSVPLDPQELRWAVEACLGLVCGGFEDDPVQPVRIGPMDAPSRTLTLSLPWLFSYREHRDSGLFVSPDTALVEISRPEGTVIGLHDLLRALYLPIPGDEPVQIPVGGFDRTHLVYQWKNVAAAGNAEVAEEALRAIIPGLDRVYVLENAILLKLEGARKPVPLESMGDGTHRAFGVALSLLRAAGGVVLIDEVESGLHHSVQDEVWEAIFSLAEQFQVQVFATTHSWDAVVGFQYAANRSPAKGVLYRLGREPDGNVRPTHYSEEEVAIAADMGIEVR